MKLNVVIVEDDPWQAAPYTRVLKTGGFAAVTARSTQEAIDIIDDSKPAAIILDLLLPGATAMTLLNELQSHSDLAVIPVVIATSSPEQLSLQTVSPYGVTQILDKSTMHPNELLTAVRRVTS